MRIFGFVFVLFLAACIEGDGTRRVAGSGGETATDQTAAAADAVLAAPIGTVSRSASRTALVIGNSRYSAIPSLANPASDARLMARTLSGLGFRVEGGGAQLDLTRGQMASALNAYRSRLASRGGIGVVYFAGHAVQVGGRNWLAPTNVAPRSAGDVANQFIPAEAFFGTGAGGGDAVNLVILDACRDNPFQNVAGARSTAIEGLRGASAGLSRVVAPPDTLVAFATAPGAVALDGSGSNSPYAIALSRALAEPGVRVEDVFIRTRNIVEKATGGVQTPWETSSLTQRVVLNGTGGTAAAPLTTAYDGTYIGPLKCNRHPDDPEVPDFAQPSGRLVRVNISGGRGRYLKGPAKAIAAWDGKQFHETFDFRISETGKVTAPGVYQFVEGPRRTQKIGAPMVTNAALLRGTADGTSLKLRGARGPRQCTLELERL